MRPKYLLLLMLIIGLSCKENDKTITNNNELNHNNEQDYFPLQVGNTWTYELLTPDPKNELNGKILTLSIVGTKSFDNKTYFLFKSDIPSIKSPWDSALFRESDQKVFRRINGQDYLWYDFRAQNGQSWRVPIGDLSALVTVSTIIDNKMTVPAGLFVNCYNFHFIEGYDAQRYEFFAPQVGLIYVGYATLLGLRCDLQKAKVNNVIYP